MEAVTPIVEEASQPVVEIVRNSMQHKNIHVVWILLASSLLLNLYQLLNNSSKQKQLKKAYRATIEKAYYFVDMKLQNMKMRERVEDVTSEIIAESMKAMQQSKEYDSIIDSYQKRLSKHAKSSKNTKETVAEIKSLSKELFDKFENTLNLNFINKEETEKIRNRIMTSDAYVENSFRKECEKAQKYEKENALLKSENESLWLSNSAILEKLNLVTAVSQTFADENQQLNMNLSTFKNENDSLEKRNSKLISIIRKFDTANIAGKVTDLIETYLDSEKHIQEVARVSKESAEKDSQIQILKNDIEAHKSNNSKNKEKLDSMFAESIILKSEIGSLKVELNYLKDNAKAKEDYLHGQMVDVAAKQEEARKLLDLSKQDKSEMAEELIKAREALQKMAENEGSTQAFYETKLSAEVTKFSQSLITIQDLQQKNEVMDSCNLELRQKLAELASLLAASDVPFHPLLKQLQNSNSQNSAKRPGLNPTAQAQPTDFVEAYKHLFEAPNTTNLNGNDLDKFRPAIPPAILPQELQAQALGIQIAPQSAALNGLSAQNQQFGSSNQLQQQLGDDVEHAILVNEEMSAGDAQTPINGNYDDPADQTPDQVYQNQISSPQQQEQSFTSSGSGDYSKKYYEVDQDNIVEGSAAESGDEMAQISLPGQQTQNYCNNGFNGVENPI